MKTKELSEQVREKWWRVQIRVGLQKVTNTLLIPQTTIKSIITKWKEYGNTTNLPCEGFPPRLTGWIRRALIREETKRSNVSLKRLESSTEETGVSVQRNTNFKLYVPQKWALQRRGQKKANTYRQIH